MADEEPNVTEEGGAEEPADPATADAAGAEEETPAEPAATEETAAAEEGEPTAVEEPETPKEGDTDKPPDEAKKEEKKPKPGDTKKGDVKQLFDSKGSLLETQSFVREKLEEFKGKRAAVAKLIGELQAKVKAYKEKENPTDDDIANLKKYHAQFLEKLGEYEEMTRNLEKLMGMADVPTSQLDMRMSGPPITKPKDDQSEKPKPKEPSPQVPIGFEEKLPKLIVCGTDMGDSVPKIIVCEPLRKKDLEPWHEDGKPGTGPTVPSGECDPAVLNKLNECFMTQQKLAAENAEMSKMRHQQQQQLLDMQEMMDNMKQRMMVLDMENRKMANENSDLQKQLMLSQGQKPGSPPMCKRELYMKFRGQPPDGLEVGQNTSITRPGAQDNMQDLEQELVKMGGDIVSIANELDTIQREKTNLGYLPSPKKPVCKRMLPQVGTQTDEDKEKDLLFDSDKDPKYKDLREQYQRLHNDFKNKVTEVASLRVDLDKTRKELEEITILHHELEAMHQKEVDQNNALMSEKNQIQAMKDQLVDLEQQANMAKQMFKASQEEMEEMRSLIEDQATQLDEYRNKYMKTLQIAEELKKENEFKERECADQIAMEIQRVKLEMQEQLEELSPIKDLLKITQQKLKETEQMHTIALETIADMSQQLEDARAQVDSMKDKIAAVEGHGDLQENLQHSLEVAEKRMTELENENTRLKEVVTQLEGNQAVQRDQLEQKSQELLQMVAQLETLREESARQVARVKERSEMIRKCLQAQIAEMEREVAQCRAATAFANRERDEIRSKLQMEICLLSENFRDSQNRIVQLQQHVNYLSASHPTSLIDSVAMTSSF